MSNRALILLMSSLLLVGVVTGRCAEKTKNQTLLVSCFSLGTGGGTVSAAAFAGAVSAGENGCSAAAAPWAEAWNKCPDGVNPDAWVSVVLAGFGRHADAFVFMFDGPDGSARLMAHVPYDQRLNPGGWAWVPPVNQLAFLFLSAHRRGLENGKKIAVSTKLSIEIRDTVEAAAGIAPPATLSAAAALPAVEALLCATLCQNGWAPAWNTAENGITLEAVLGFRAFSFRLTNYANESAAPVVKENAPEEQCHDYLSRMVQILSNPNGQAPRDFTGFGEGKALLLAATTDRLIVATTNGLAAHDTHTGRQVWPLGKAKPIRGEFVARQDANGNVTAFRYSGGVAVVNLENGVETILAATAPIFPWGFASRGDGLTVVARGTTLSAYGAAKQLWSREETSGIAAGPALNGDGVFAGTEAGDIFCLDLISGEEKWKHRYPAEWQGYIVCFEDLMLVFDRAERTLVALRAADGSVLWKCSLGDVLLKAPVMVEKQLLVACKNNRILLINIMDGRVVRDLTWPTWILDILSVGDESAPMIAFTDIRGQLNFLNSSTLERIKTISLPTRRPSGPMVFVPTFPVIWGEAASADKDLDGVFTGDVKPALLVGDTEGFCHIVSLP